MSTPRGDVRRCMTQHSLRDRREIVAAISDGRAVRDRQLAESAIIYASYIMQQQSGRERRPAALRIVYRFFHPGGYTRGLEGPNGRAKEALNSNEVLLREPSG